MELSGIILPLSQLNIDEDRHDPEHPQVPNPSDPSTPLRSERAPSSCSPMPQSGYPSPSSSEGQLRRLRHKQPHPRVVAVVPPGVVGAPVRRRLRGKQRGDHIPRPDPQPVLDPPVQIAYPDLWSRLDESLFDQEGRSRECYFAVYNRLRHLFQTLSGDIEPSTTDPFEKYVLQATRDWKRMSAANKCALVNMVLDRSRPPPCVVTWCQRQWPSPEMAESVPVLRSATVLLTWNGDWGLLPEISAQCVDLPLCDVRSLLRQHEHVQRLWGELQELQQTIVQTWHVESWTLALEFCPQTLRTSQSLRLHGHLFVRSNARMRVGDQPFLTFKGSAPHKSLSINGFAVRASTAFQGHYYLHCPKTSSVLVASNKLPFQDFVVNPAWVWNAISSGKMEYADARSEFTRIGKNFTANLRDLDAWHVASSEQRLQERVQLVQSLLRSSQQQFHELPSVTSWLQRFGSGVHSRKPILVLTGPSGTGKSSFVRSLVGSDALLELNCAGVAHVHLTGFDAEKTRMILWDELPAKTVLAHRKLFQHPPVMVDIGHSPTGAHVRKYWLADCVSVVCTNTWEEELAAMSESDRAWLTANTVVEVVTTQLWVQAQ